MRKNYRLKLLGKLILWQVAAVALSVLVVLVGYVYIVNSAIKSNHDLVKSKTVSELDKYQEKWRAWYQVGLNDVLDEELKKVKSSLMLDRLEVVELGLGENIKSNNLIIFPRSTLPEITESGIYLIAKPSMSRDLGIVPNTEFLWVLAIITFLFLVIVGYSAIYLVRNIYTPLSQLRFELGEMKTHGILDTSNIRANGEIQEFIDDLQKLYVDYREIEKQRTLVEFTAQMAHDIRSPLAALGVLGSDSIELNNESKVLIKESLTRLQQIANGFLNFDKQVRAKDLNEVKTVNIGKTLTLILKEKRIEYIEKSNISFKETIKIKDKDVFVRADPVEIARVFSNLINNAVEAIVSNGEVRVSLEVFEKQLKVFISDDGKGVPKSVEIQLGQRGFSFNKENGSGFGLWHARKTIADLGGTLSFNSELGKGTEVIVCLPIFDVRNNVHKPSSSQWVT